MPPDTITAPQFDFSQLYGNSGGIVSDPQPAPTAAPPSLDFSHLYGKQGKQVSPPVGQEEDVRSGFATAPPPKPVSPAERYEKNLEERRAGEKEYWR